MLRSISWARFGAVVFLGLAVYYPYVMIRFYRKDLWGFIKGRRDLREVPWPAAAPKKKGLAGVTAVGEGSAASGVGNASERRKVWRIKSTWIS